MHWLSLALLGYYALVFVDAAANLVAYPFDVDQGESYDTWSAWLLANKMLPYTDNQQFPFYSSNYPPVWSALVALPMQWTGPSLATGRLVSIIAALGCAALLGIAAYRYTARLSRPPTAVLAGALAFALFLASPYVFHTTPLARVNGTTLLFSIIALGLFEETTRRRVIVGTLVLLAALFTKQTAVDAALACLGYTLMVRPRLALQAGLLLLGLGGTLLGALLIATGGAFWLNVVAGNANPFDLGQLIRYLANFFVVHGVVFTLAAVECRLALQRRFGSPWVLYFPLAAGLSLTVGKWGAGESYFLPLIAASCVLGASLLARLAMDRETQQALLDRWRWRPTLTRSGLVWAIAVAGMVQVLLLSHGPLASIPGLPDRGIQGEFLGSLPFERDREAGAQLSAILRLSERPALVEDAGFLLAAGKPIVANPTHLRNLYEAGQWDPAALVTMIDSHDFGIIVLNAQLYPAPVLSAIGRSYYVERSIHVRGAEYLVFLPGAD